MKKGLRRTIIILVVLAAAAALAYLAYMRYLQKPKAQASAQPLDLSIPVVVVKPKAGSISETLPANGSVRALTEVSLFSTVAGKVRKILVAEGDRVEQGQVVAYVGRDEAGLSYADAPLESTIPGIVKQVLTEVGASVSPSMPLFQIVDMDQVEVVIHIPEKDIPRVRVGMRAEVNLISYPGRVFQGAVYKLSPVVDPASRTREALILVPNQAHTLKPGMFGTTEIILRTIGNTILIPSAALITREDKQILFLFRDGKAVELTPQIETVKGEQTAIRVGLGKEDRVIVVGQHNLKDGDPVKIVEERE